MALNIGQYVDPGVYVGEVVVPGSVSVSTVPLAVCLIGTASRSKRVLNEAVTRGLVSGETLVVSSTPGAHTAQLINVSNRRSAQMIVYRDGVALESDTLTIMPASVTGVGSLANQDMTTSNKIALSMDGKSAVTIAIVGGGADQTTISGGLITQRLTTVSTITAVTPAQIAEGINKALAGAASLGYGGAYGAVATVVGGGIVLTSPVSTPMSDVKLYTAFPVAQSKTATVFGATTQAKTVIKISDVDYGSMSQYTINYVSVDSTVDELANDGVQKIVRVGNYAGVTSFRSGTDFAVANDSLDWSADTAAVFTSSIASATFDISPNNKIVLAIDGKAALTIDLTGMASPPPGYANAVNADAATPVEIANNINAVLANSAVYGPKYASVASVSGTGASSKLVLTSPIDGVGSMIELGASQTNSAVTALLGLTSSQLPYSTYGVGAQPIAGAIYFATYEYTRPTSEYNVAKRYFTPDATYVDIGAPSKTNKLAIGAGICFDNGAPSVIVVQVNDQNFNGSPTQTEIKAALDAAGNTSAATEIVVLDTRLGVHVDMMDHIASQCSPTVKNYRRGWFGMARSTLIGDKDTADTLIHRSVRTLQVPSDSPARGRIVLVAPGAITRSVTSEDGSTTDMALDGSYLAAAVAAKMTSFTGPAETLLRKTVTGFRIDNFPTYLKAERALLASNGVTVVTLDAGRLVLTDPITTEAGGGKLVTFQEISASTQKDAVTLAVQDTVDNNLVGIVPTDLASFVLTIKSHLADVLNTMIAQGSIAPFKNEDGVTRDIDMTRDIQVFQDKNDQTKFSFRYFYNLRLPAKRFFGEYSVNNPFWTS